MSKDTMLTTQEKEIIALGVSIAAGCQPCTMHHLEAARAAGVCSRGTTLAINIGADVRRAAADAMAAWAIDQHGTVAQLTDEWVAQQGVVRALVSVAAAFAVNSVAQFEKFALEACSLGANDRQLELAVGIARRIKGVASQKIEAAAHRFVPERDLCGAEPKTVSGGCGCAATVKQCGAERPEAEILSEVDDPGLVGHYLSRGCLP